MCVESLCQSGNRGLSLYPAFSSSACCVPQVSPSHFLPRPGGAAWGCDLGVRPGGAARWACSMHPAALPGALLPCIVVCWWLWPPKPSILRWVQLHQIFFSKTRTALFFSENKSTVPRCTDVYNKSKKTSVEWRTTKYRIVGIFGGGGTMGRSREGASPVLGVFYFLSWRWIYRFLLQYSLNHFEILNVAHNAFSLFMIHMTMKDMKEKWKSPLSPIFLPSCTGNKPLVKFRPVSFEDFVCSFFSLYIFISTMTLIIHTDVCYKYIVSVLPFPIHNGN